jgi:hypothetical protein
LATPRKRTLVQSRLTTLQRTDRGPWFATELCCARRYGICEPLVMLDLDNTLIDRDGAFRRWAESFVTSCRGTVSDVAWVVDADRDGYEARERLADLSASASVSGTRLPLLKICGGAWWTGSSWTCGPRVAGPRP